MLLSTATQRVPTARAANRNQTVVLLSLGPHAKLRRTAALASRPSPLSNWGSRNFGTSVPRTVTVRASGTSAQADITVEQIMIKNPIVFKDSADIKEAVKMMLDKNISGAPVVDSTGSLVGVLSESDVIWKGVGTPLDHYLIPPTYISILDAVVQLRDQKQILSEEQKILSRTVAEAMTKEVISIGPNATLSAAAQLMLSRKVNRLPVVSSDGKVVGVLTRHDVLKGIYDTKSFL